MLLTFPIPASLHGEHLAAEIEAALGVSGVTVSINDDELEVVVPEGTEATEVAAVIAIHTGEQTPEEVLAAEIRATGFPFTTEQYAEVRVQKQKRRSLRQMGRAAFMALPENERWRLIYEDAVAGTIIDLAMLRDDSP